MLGFFTLFLDIPKNRIVPAATGVLLTYLADVGLLGVSLAVAFLLSADLAFFAALMPPPSPTLWAGQRKGGWKKSRWQEAGVFPTHESTPFTGLLYSMLHSCFPSALDNSFVMWGGS